MIRCILCRLSMNYRISILAYNLQTEFKKGFYKRIRYTEATPRQLKYVHRVTENFNTTFYYGTPMSNLIKVFIYTS